MPREIIHPLLRRKSGQEKVAVLPARLQNFPFPKLPTRLNRYCSIARPDRGSPAMGEGWFALDEVRR
jgi:hypothetical protein